MAQLRLNDAGRAALADGANRGLRAVTFTRISAGSGYGPGGAADDGRAALRNERDSAAVEGSTRVAGELALCGAIAASAAYDVREIGLWGRAGDGPETLYAYYTHPTDKFAAATPGATVLVAGVLRVGPASAQVAVDASVKVTLESQGLMPVWLLPRPHVNTAGNRLAANPAAAARGGTVAVAGGQGLSLGQPSASGKTGFSRGFETPAWATQDLDANATYFLRAQVVNGELSLYAAKGADADATPGSLRGVPGAAAGGGFPSTALDARLAKIVTGAAGSVPEVTRYALKAGAGKGLEPWSPVEQYKHPRAAWGSDRALYLTVRDSFGVDPVKDADRSHWRPALLIAGLAEGTPEGRDWVAWGDRSAGAPGLDKRVDINKLPVVGGSAQGAPAKTDRLKFGDVSAAGVPNLEVEIQKLPGALAPAGGVVEGKKYAFKALASGAFELGRVAAIATFASALITVNALEGHINPPSRVVGEVLDVPAGTYVAAFGYRFPVNASGQDPLGRSIKLQRMVPGNNWADVGTAGWEGGSQSSNFGAGFARYLFRKGWVFDQDSQVRILFSINRGWQRAQDIFLLMAEE